jgi:hypothetical protein
MSPDTPRYTGQPLGKGATAQKLEEIKLKKPYPLVVNLEAPRPLHTPRRLGRTQLPPHLTESCASDRPWAVSIWRQAYPQHARHAAQAALQIAIKLDARPIIALDHGEALGPAPFHGIPPTPELAEVPLATAIPTKIEGAASLTEIPHLILQAARGQTPHLGQKIAKTEYYEAPRRRPCAKRRKTTLTTPKKDAKP